MRASLAVFFRRESFIFCSWACFLLTFLRYISQSSGENSGASLPRRAKAARREGGRAFRQVDAFPQFPEIHVVVCARSYEDNFRIRSVDFAARLSVLLPQRYPPSLFCALTFFFLPHFRGSASSRAVLCDPCQAPYESDPLDQEDRCPPDRFLSSRNVLEESPRSSIVATTRRKPSGQLAHGLYYTSIYRLPYLFACLCVFTNDKGKEEPTRCARRLFTRRLDQRSYFTYSHREALALRLSFFFFLCFPFSSVLLSLCV